MTRLHMSGANLRAANLSGADLSGADLSDSKISRAYLNGADMRASKMSGADLSHTNMSAANLSSASMNGAEMKDAELSGVTNGGVRVLAILTLRKDYTFFVCADGLIRAGCRTMTPADFRSHVHEKPHMLPRDKLTLAMIATAEAIYSANLDRAVAHLDGE